MSPLRARCMCILACLAARGCSSADCHVGPSIDSGLMQLAAVTITWRLGAEGEDCKTVCSTSGETCDAEAMQDEVDKRSSNLTDYPVSVLSIPDPDVPKGCSTVSVTRQVAVPGTYMMGDCRLFSNRTATVSCTALPVGSDFHRWCACRSGRASATGDPHIRNVLGQKFEIRRTGTHTFVSIPKGAAADVALLRVDALVEPEELACSAMFIRRLHVAGRWLRPAPALTFSAGAGTPGSQGGPGLQVGNLSLLTMQEFASRVPSRVVQLSAPAGAVEEPSAANRHATSMVASLRLGPTVGMKVSWVTERTPAMSLARSLWVSFTGLSTLYGSIGGLLGTDDHQEASALDPGCIPFQRPSLMKVGDGHAAGGAAVQE